MMDATMADRLIARRKAAGLSQEALADRLGVSRQAVSKWERVESSPDTDNLIALAALYGITLDELLYADPKAANGEKDREPAGATGDDATSDTEPAGTDDAPMDAGDAGWDGHVSVSWREGIHVVDPKKGEEVHIGLNGIHVDNPGKGESVHVGPGGMHVDTPDDGGHSVHTRPDGGVTIDGRDFKSWGEAHDALGHGGKGASAFRRGWRRFPFPAIVGAAYLALGVTRGLWAWGLLLFLLLPVYYVLGKAIDRRDPFGFVAGAWPWAAVCLAIVAMAAQGDALQVLMWIVVGIPVVSGLAGSLSRWWRHR